ncbi:phospholipase D family protein [Salibacterium qingdaonense]|uniref:phospholipase D n=1 Tax=Salibacterium qingdaonense TaxID=266892 RepID=A0A1I4I132_9BACI|nr:phospholipase D family protein [Salibacterium qingdaonense]SFL48142.1 PLD-like domain-containing protein [Salibacterium qingdaonense]
MTAIFTRRPVVAGLLILMFCVMMISVYHLYKKVPDHTSVEGDVHRTNDIEFLYDLTYQKSGEQQQEQVIFDRVFEMIQEAEDFIVVDMFLFNGQYDQSMNFPAVAGSLADALVEKKQNHPNMDIVVITDRINTFYGSYKTDTFTSMKEADIPVFYTNMKPLRDSNPAYSGVYRTFFQWFGTGGKGWLPNAFSPDAPDVTLRSYLELLNFKANHRKTVITEDRGLVTSANPHDASADHSNIGFEIKGGILEDMLKTEQAVAEMAGADPSLFSSMEVEDDSSKEGPYQLQLLTEGKIEKHTLKEIREAGAGDRVTVGAFYLSDRDVISALLKAADRGVDVRLVLDPNKDAFGREKNGIPNRPAAAELVEDSGGDVEVKWYHTNGEQFHTKMVFVEKETEDVLIGGSANYTKRNIGDFNLETNVKISAASDTEVMEKTDAYFQRVWNNEEGRYTEDYETFADESALSYWLYRFQEWSGLSSF